MKKNTRSALGLIYDARVVDKPQRYVISDRKTCGRRGMKRGVRRD